MLDKSHTALMIRNGMGGERGDGFIYASV